MKKIMVFAIFTALFCGCIGGGEKEINCEDIPDRIEAQMCMLNQSVRRLDIQGCDEILDRGIKIQCIDEIAIRLGEYYYCRFHDRKPDRDRCEDKVGEARRAARASS
jgi:hypothetical protein